MTDLKQVADRMHKVHAYSNWVAYDGAKYRDQLYAVDQQIAVRDWLAERDPTPLTESVLKSFGFALTNDSLLSDWHRDFPDYTIMLQWNVHDRCHVTEGDMLPIRTVGELRTLARLAGVDLTKGAGR